MELKLIFIMCLLVCLSCKNDSDLQSSQEKDAESTLVKSDDTDEAIQCECTDGMVKVDELVWPDEDEWPEGLDWAVKLKLKPQADKSYLATEDAQIKDLTSKYGVTLWQTYWGPKSTPELLLYYTLLGKGSMSWEFRENVIKDILATGKFEDCVYVYDIAYTTNN